MYEQTFSSSPPVDISPIQQNAMDLHRLCLNVFPVPYGKKGGWPWRNLQHTRLLFADLHKLFRGQCNTAVMMGRTSGNLFVIDCETEASFFYHKHMLEKHHIPIWAVRTGSNKGGGHFYLRCSEGEVKGFKAEDFEIRGSRCYVLAPTSLHPDGGFYTFYQCDQPVPPTVQLSDLTWLDVKLVKQSRPVNPDPLKIVCNETRNYIYTGAVEGERNTRLFKAACDLAGNGFDEASTFKYLYTISENIGLSRSEINATIKSAYSQPRTPSRPANQPITIRHWEIAETWAQNRQWAGRSGQTDRVVFLACCQRAKTANDNGTFRASSREIAEMAGVTRKTVSRSLKRLVAEHILIYSGTDQQSGANLYRLGNDTTKNPRNDPTNSLPVSGFFSGVTAIKMPITHDASERKALGKTAYNLYTVMIALDKPYRGKALAEYAKLSIGQVYRALKKLREYGLVEKVKGGFEAIPQEDVDHALIKHVAIPAKTLGKTKARKRKHQWGRAKYAGRELDKARYFAKRNGDHIGVVG